MNPPIVWIRAAILLTWIFVPPVLAVVSEIRAWRVRGFTGAWRLGSPFVIGTVAVTDWLIFFFLLSRSGNWHPMPYHFSTVLLLVTLLLAIASLRAYAARTPLIIANLVLASLWFAFGYAPEHWLTFVNIGSVTVDQRDVPATIYFGNPRNSEAETIALIHVPNLGNYYFDFAEEKYRQASEWDAVLTPYGAWTWHHMTQGRLLEPLPSSEMDECRIPLTGGHILTIRF